MSSGTAERRLLVFCATRGNDRFPKWLQSYLISATWKLIATCNSDTTPIEPTYLISATWKLIATSPAVSLAQDQISDCPAKCKAVFIVVAEVDASVHSGQSRFLSHGV